MSGGNKMIKNFRRGQVWFYKPTVSPTGSIQKGPRPVIIVSNNVLNSSSGVVLAVPCTTQIKRNFPTHVLFVMNNRINAAVTEQVCPVNVEELDDLKCTLDDYIMEQVDAALKVALGFTSVTGWNSSPKPTEVVNIVNNCVDNNKSKPVMGNQVNKFYSKYPQCKPSDTGKDSNKWTVSRMRQFLSEFDLPSSSFASVPKKYNLSESTARSYFKKFTTLVGDSKNGSV